MAILDAAEPLELGALTRRLELDSLRLLAVVAREGSYAKAARTEPLTASAISKRIAELERAMGYLLLERSVHGVRPTMAGELVLAHWAELAATLGTLLSVADNVTQPAKVKMAVVADPESARFLVYDCLSHLDALEDDSQVSVTRSSTGWLPVEFNKQQAHAAIWRVGDVAGRAPMHSIHDMLFERFDEARHYRFTAEVCIAAVRNDHPLAPLGLLSGMDLEDYELVCTSSLLDHVRSRMNIAGEPDLVPGLPRVKLLRPSWSHQIASTLEFLESVPTGTVALLPTSARYVMHRYPGLRSLSLTEDQGCMEFRCVLREDAWLSERTHLVERLTGAQLVAMDRPAFDGEMAGRLDPGLPDRNAKLPAFPHGLGAAALKSDTALLR